MTQTVNQFRPSTEKGILDLAANTNIIKCHVDPSSASTTISGATPVKLISGTGDRSIIVDVLAALTDEVFGFVIYNAVDNNPQANDKVNVAIDNSIMYMEAGAAIDRGATVEVAASNKIITSAGTNTKIGIALDAALADGDLVRVLIKSPLLA